MESRSALERQQHLNEGKGETSSETLNSRKRKNTSEEFWPSSPEQIIADFRELISQKKRAQLEKDIGIPFTPAKVKNYVIYWLMTTANLMDNPNLYKCGEIYNLLKNKLNKDEFNLVIHYTKNLIKSTKKMSQEQLHSQKCYIEKLQYCEKKQKISTAQSEIQSLSKQTLEEEPLVRSNNFSRLMDNPPRQDRFYENNSSFLFANNQLPAISQPPAITRPPADNLGGEIENPNGWDTFFRELDSFNSFGHNTF